MVMGKVTIAFQYSSPLGETYSAESTMSPFELGGEREIDVIGRQFLRFLRQSGFYVGDKDYLLLEGLSPEEYEFLSKQLDEYRKSYKDGDDV